MCRKLSMLVDVVSPVKVCSIEMSSIKSVTEGVQVRLISEIEHRIVAHAVHLLCSIKHVEGSLSLMELSLIHSKCTIIVEVILVKEGPIEPELLQRLFLRLRVYLSTHQTREVLVVETCVDTVLHEDDDTYSIIDLDLFPEHETSMCFSQSDE